MSYDPLLTPREASAFLGLSRSWLAKLRLTGDGPSYIKLGRQVRYRLGDLEAWLQGHVQSSTSDTGSRALGTSLATREAPVRRQDEGAGALFDQEHDAADGPCPSSDEKNRGGDH
jgi:predicted DNA-binding transcriptional regulator AlpA